MTNILKVTTNHLHNIDILVKTNNIAYIDAIVHYCEKTGLDVEYIGGLIKKDSTFKSKVEADAIKNRVLKKDGSPSLPI